MKVYFEEDSGHILTVEEDCPVSKDGKLLFARELEIGDVAEVHLGEGWFISTRCSPNKTLTFILNLEVPDWAKTKEAYHQINAAILGMIGSHREMFVSHTLASQKPLDE